MKVRNTNPFICPRKFLENIQLQNYSRLFSNTNNRKFVPVASPLPQKLKKNNFEPFKYYKNNVFDFDLVFYCIIIIVYRCKSKRSCINL